MNHITSESDNVFSDLGFDHAEAANLKMRSELMVIIEQYISDNGLTQEVAAKQMGVDQPRINKLLKGNIDLFTIDALVKMLDKVGVKMKLKRVV